MDSIPGKCRSRPVAVAIVVATLGVWLSVPAAMSSVGAAEPPTRDAYVAELESICKPGADATQRAMKGARADIRAERFGVAAGKFAGSAKIFGSTLARIKRPQRPPNDLERLRKWFGYLDKQESYLRRIADQFRHDRPIEGQRSISRFIHNGNLANNVVLAFGFDHCSFKFSRYG